MEAFLQEYFLEDETAQENLRSGAFVLTQAYTNLIHPAVWHSVIQPDMDIDFSFELPGAALTPPVTVDHEADLVTETEYENRVQYKVQYYRRATYGAGVEFVRESIYSEPVQLEVADTFDKLPVLEEQKRVTSEADLSSSRTTTGLTDLAVNRRAENRETKTSKLKSTDIVHDTELKVHSPYLLNILKAVIEYSAELPGSEEEGLDVGVFTYPYKDLYHHLEDILAYKLDTHPLRARHSPAFNQAADKHIDLLQRYLEFHPLISFKDAKARWSRSVPLTTFGTFWLLMKPGTDVYVREDDGSLSRYVLDRLLGGVSDPTLKAWHVDYRAWVWKLVLDGKVIRQKSRMVKIHTFDNERNIMELPVFPASYHDVQDGGSLLRALADRGRKFFSYSNRPCFLQYNGHGLKPGSRSVSS